VCPQYQKVWRAVRHPPVQRVSPHGTTSRECVAALGHIYGATCKGCITALVCICGAACGGSQHRGILWHFHGTTCGGCTTALERTTQWNHVLKGYITAPHHIYVATCGGCITALGHIYVAACKGASQHGAACFATVQRALCRGRTCCATFGGPSSATARA